MAAKFFATQQAFRRWLERNHDSEPELIVGFYKVSSGRKGMTYREAVDEALCFGWIDGLTHRIDEERYQIRFTPRRRNSTWSSVNVERVGELTKAGRMHPAGLKVFEERDRRKQEMSIENTPATLDPAAQRRLKAVKGAWRFFNDQPPGYRRLAVWWISSAKKPETRDRRLGILIEHSAAGRRVPQLSGQAAAPKK